MFWSKTNKIKPLSSEVIQVAEFYHRVASNTSWGSEADKFVANELNTYKPFEVAGMVIDRLSGVNEQEEIRERTHYLVTNFKTCMKEYMAKLYKKETVSQND